MRQAELRLDQSIETATGRRFLFHLAAGADSTDVVVNIPCDPEDIDHETALLAAQHRLTSMLHEAVLANRRIEAALVMPWTPSALLH